MPSKKSLIKKLQYSGHPQPLEAKSIFADTFIPHNKKALNLAPVSERWKCDTTWIERNGSDAHRDKLDMEKAIVSLAQNFIPAIKCRCNESTSQPPPHGESLWLPTLPHSVAPNYQFALHDNPMRQAAHERLLPGVVDLDETTSVAEYSSMFEQALRLEYEEHLRLYELYSLYDVHLHPLEPRPHPRMSDNRNGIGIVYKQVRLVVDGIADARPTLQVGDIALLRPIPYGRQYATTTIEIESRVLGVIRGRKDVKLPAGKNGLLSQGIEKDQIILSWGLNHQQCGFLGLAQNSSASWNLMFNVRFVPSAAPMERCLTALDWLKTVSTTHPEALNDVLFPVHAPSVKPLTQKEIIRMKQDDSDFNKPLNELQSSFVRMVGARTRDPEFNSTRPPMILTGPAGTGKTKTLMVAIADCLGLMPSDVNDVDTYKNNNRVLVCAPSHAAADVITNRLKGFVNHGAIFRLYDRSRPKNTVPANIIPFTCRNDKENEFTLPTASSWNRCRVIVCTCMDAHILFRAKITNEAIYKRKTCFRRFLSSDSNNLGFALDSIPADSDPYFSHLFIDEAAQATEPEILIPISCVIDPYPGAKKCEIAFVGDPRQLSPLVFSEKAIKYGLARSVMERLLKRPVKCMGWGEDHMLGPVASSDNLFDDKSPSSLMDLIRYYATVDGQEQLTIFLCENYRGHPSFLMMPSSLFYFDRLKGKKNQNIQELEFWIKRLREVEALSLPLKCQLQKTNGGAGNIIVDKVDSFNQVHKQSNWPILFLGVKGEDKSVALDSFTGTDSWQNSIEAAMVLEIVTTLVDGGVVTSRIGVMAPFRGQVVLIRQFLRMQNFFDVNVGTIENYQGVEQDVIIFSLTRSNEHFVTHDIKRRMGVFGEVRYKQANVALTRAENLFIMLGNPEVMWKDRLWRQWLMFCYRNGLWYGRGLAENDMQMMSDRGSKLISSAQEETNPDEMHVIVSTLEKVLRLS